ncbi:hypothetical protein EYF80_054125 [Liparis tanakae]|uniref:Uncharacterized protein n=1 Tax=Liparis tanakae TaxID=230148 RepID=A0A4Z2F3U0_9TELE|nr:hypothetical protein EYF80_054125 [Liparis tanakae]
MEETGAQVRRRRRGGRGGGDKKKKKKKKDPSFISLRVHRPRLQPPTRALHPSSAATTPPVVAPHLHAEEQQQQEEEEEEEEEEGGGNARGRSRTLSEKLSTRDPAWTSRSLGTK